MPRSVAVFAYVSTTRNESNSVGTVLPESCSAASFSATCASAAGSRSSSELISLPSTNVVTRHGGSSSTAATEGAIPSSAAWRLASASAARSISSSEVSLPGTRITYSRAAEPGAEVSVRYSALERDRVARRFAQPRGELLHDLYKFIHGG